MIEFSINIVCSMVITFYDKKITKLTNYNP